MQAKLFWFGLAMHLVAVSAALYLIFMLQKRENIRLNKIIDDMKKELAKFNMEVQVASSQVSAVSEQLHVTLDENSAFTQQLYAETADMVQQNLEVNESIKNMVSVVKSITELLHEANKTSNEMQDKSTASNAVIKHSLEEILEIVNTIGGIQHSTNKTMEYMERLNTSSKEIVKILETVNNISNQIHLLSLNASIESARAGEAGKGFSVVAEEIRKLSLVTSNAVNDINNLISSIQEEVHSVFDVVKENSRMVEKSVMATNQVEKNLEKIEISFDEVVNLVKKIIDLSEKEGDFTRKIEGNIKTVEEKVKLTAQSVNVVMESVHKQKNNIEDIAGLSERLYESAGDLKKLFEGLETDYTEDNRIPGMEQDIMACRQIIRELHENQRFVALDKLEHQKLLDSIKERYAFVEAVWTNDKKGKFIYSVPPSGIANAAVREWFKQSIKGEEYTSRVYISAITKSPCITFSAPIVSNAGDIVGVAGIDLKLNNI
jgi:methyl-accepting chemotaxis protein